ncbi:hypothetical protein [Oleiharenicola lentus]|uniref:hypothetical protein n=1 Tax=Oleiharenicola lentus TaxID=2508720 RepID=UPI003F6668B6
MSLSFFEAHLLRRGLKQNGCREIWVAADIDGYAQSLAERQALSVGQDYRLVPISLRNGVFHPKCVYLHGADGDVLIVGSGNLTFGGYGKNVEVAEVFHSKEHPAIFVQFADFLRALKKRSDLFCPDDAWISLFANHADRSGVGAPAGASVRLVHCVEAPVDEQLVAAVARTAVEELRVLSPYYDADAGAVRLLTARLGSRKTTIGLLAGQEEQSAYPFKRSANQVSAALVVVDEPARRLHAKWIEIEVADKGGVTLTGSINATTQSLCTTKNIELGVLRTGEAPTWLRWTKTKIPARHVIHERSLPGIGSRFMLHAKILELGVLRATVLPAPKSEGTWRVTLSQVNGDSISFSAEVDASGVFEIRLEKTEGFDFASGLQLSIERNDESARAWVQNEWLLELARARNVPTGSILRFLRGESAEDDDLSVLEFLSSCLDDLPSARVEATAPTKTAEHEPTKEQRIAIEELAPHATASIAANLPGDRKENRIQQLLQRLLGRFEFDLAKSSEAHAGADAASDGDSEESTDDGSPDDKRSSARFERAIDRFRGFVRERIQALAGSSKARGLCNVWFVVETLFRSRQQDSAMDMRGFLRHWLIETARTCRLARATDILDERVFAITGVLAAIAIHEKNESELVGIHEALEDYGISAVPSAIRCREVAVSSLLPTAPDILTAFARVLGAPTRRSEAKAVYDAVKSRQPFAKNMALLQTSDGRQLAEIRRSGSSPKVRELQRGASVCPMCYKGFSRQFQVSLERLRFAQCVPCETFYFDLDHISR